jgi:hypothetical protein
VPTPRTTASRKIFKVFVIVSGSRVRFVSGGCWLDPHPLLCQRVGRDFHHGSWRRLHPGKMEKSGFRCGVGAREAPEGHAYSIVPEPGRRPAAENAVDQNMWWFSVVPVMPTIVRWSGSAKRSSGGGGPRITTRREPSGPLALHAAPLFPSALSAEIFPGSGLSARRPGPRLR